MPPKSLITVSCATHNECIELVYKQCIEWTKTYRGQNNAESYFLPLLHLLSFIRAPFPILNSISGTSCSSGHFQLVKVQSSWNLDSRFHFRAASCFQLRCNPNWRPALRKWAQCVSLLLYLLPVLLVTPLWPESWTGGLEVKGTRCYNSGTVMLRFQLTLAEAHFEILDKSKQFLANLL